MSIIIENSKIEISRDVWVNLNGAERMLYTVVLLDIYNDLNKIKKNFTLKIESKEQIKALFNTYMWK